MSFNLARLKKLLFLFLLAGAAVLTAEGDPTTNLVFEARAKNEFNRTQQLYQSDETNSTNAWMFASACFDLTEFATNDTQKAEIARLGIAACQQLLARESNSVGGHYYLAMNYGGLADAEAPSILSYRLVHQVETEFNLATALDEKFDYGGSLRCLGLLYRDAPAWPISIGNWRKAREYLERAAALYPDYPENQLCLAETYLKWRQREGAQKSLQRLDATWHTAQTNLTDVLWEKPWYDWTNRRAAARAEYQRLFKHVP